MCIVNMRCSLCLQPLTFLRSGSLRTQLNFVERRSKPRIKDSFPATVRSVNANGEAFETNTVLDNLSARGLHLSVMCEVEPGAKMSIVIQFSSGPTVDETRPRVEVFGEVLRAERVWSGAYGIAVVFKGYRFL